jgi:hypothetical protein
MTTKNKIALAAELTRTIADDRYPLSVADPDPAGHTRQARAAASAQAFTGAEAVRTAAVYSRPTPTGMKSRTTAGPPATLGSTARAHLRLIVWCRDCQHQVEPDPAEIGGAIRRRDHRA